MNTEQKIFNDLINTIVNNSTDNTATISNVKLWAESWQREMEEALNINDVMQAKPEKTKMKHCLLCEGKGHYYSPSLLRIIKCCKP